MTKIKLKVKSTGLHPIAQRAVAKKHLNLLLDKLPEGSTAYVAGGAPRDWHHGWGCRDIDIFFQVPTEERNQVARYMNEEYDKLNQGGYYFDDGSQGILGVHEYPATKYSPNATSTQYTKVQLIHTEQDPLDVIRDFPISLSRIWMDKTGAIECDTAYEMSYRYSTIHEMHTKQGWNYNYLDKILGRFNNYAFVPVNWKSENKDV